MLKLTFIFRDEWHRVLKDAEESKSQNNRDDLDLVKHTTTSHTSHSAVVNISEPNNSNAESYSKLFNKNEFEKNTGLTLLMQQFWAMLIKKLIYSYRNKKLIIVQVGGFPKDNHPQYYNYILNYFADGNSYSAYDPYVHLLTCFPWISWSYSFWCLQLGCKQSFIP